jgi:GNAT superfamily N-acetyltransferase
MRRCDPIRELLTRSSRNHEGRFKDDRLLGAIARGNGGGRRLLEDALRRDRDQDTVFEIEVRADNEPALGLYEDLGFVEIGSTTSETASGTATFLKLRLEPLESPGGTSLETTR